MGSLLLRVRNQTRPGPVKLVTRPSPPRIVDFQLPAGRRGEVVDEEALTAERALETLQEPALRKGRHLHVTTGHCHRPR
jgi:hypothetical protein